MHIGTEEGFAKAHRSASVRLAARRHRRALHFELNDFRLNDSGGFDCPLLPPKKEDRVEPHTSLSRSAQPAAPPTQSKKSKPRWSSISLEGIEGRATLTTHPLGFKQVSPRPTEAELADFYREDFYGKARPNYLAKMERDKAFWHATWSLRRMLIEDAVPHAPRRILDIGASSGFLLDHFRQSDWAVEGIEPSRSAVEFAQDTLGIPLFQGLLDDFPGGSARFDAVHSAQVLEHVLCPESFIDRVVDLLKPGGVAYIEVPNDFNAFQEVARDDLDKSSWWVAPSMHLNYFDADSLAALLESRGLVEMDRLASFPMEMFLLMGDDYVGFPDVGSECHQKRMRFEQTLVREGRSDTLLRFYRALGQANLGRTAGILARKPA